MAQHDYDLANQSGSSFRTDLNNCLDAIQSTNSGSSAPSSTVAFQLWADSNTGILKIRNAANDDWVGLFQLDGTLTLEDGSASTPGLAFRDDLNTGIWSSGADAVDIATGGTNRLTVNSTGLTMSGCNIVLGDSGGSGDDRIVLGAGSDLSIYHDGSNTKIQNTTGELQNFADTWRVVSNSGSNENMIRATFDAGVELFHNDVCKLETRGSDVWIKDDLILGDSDKIKLGDGGDFELYHDASNSYIKDNGTGSIITASDSWIYWMNGAASETIIKAGANSQVELYYDNARKFKTESWGTTIDGQSSVVADLSSNYAGKFFNDGNNTTRFGVHIKCGTDDASGTNYPLWFADGDGDDQGGLTFSGGTVALVAFTAAHPAEVPNSDNPSDDSLAYPYGTLVETTDITYSKKADGSETERGIIYKVQKTQSANSRKILGVYSGNMRGGPAGRTNDHEITVLGDGHILCNNAGGNIEVGDGICSSSTAGIGQKATVNPSMIIGIAQEDVTFTGSETKLVPVQFGLQQFTPWT